MSTDTLERVEIDSSILDELECGVEGCAAEVKWNLVCVGCRTHSNVFCNDHKRQVEMYFRTQEVRGLALECRSCGRCAPDWHDVAEFLPA